MIGKRLSFHCLVTAALWFGGDVYAAHGVVTISNPNGNPVIYQIKWGESAEWRDIKIPPKSEYHHSHRLDENGQAPIPYIRFDDYAGDGKVTYQEYKLEFGRNSGIQYEFRYSHRVILDLKKK